jgi:signal transduction histidine kinase
LQISVADTGPGIPEKNLTTIFEKFQQVNTKASYKTKGTGLGLAIAKQVITHHGGKIWAESKLGEGSTFFILLPA